MAVGWFIAPYARVLENRPHPSRYCVMDDYTAQIRTDGGAWAETEVLGDRAIVKVRASDATLTTIAADVRIRRIPLNALDNPLSSLTVNQRTAIRNELLDAGYTVAEVNARFPNLANNTLREALTFLATRRRKPRYDSGTDAIILDGAVQSCRSVESVDASV